jgi:hypothetical protein
MADAAIVAGAAGVETRHPSMREHL